jgi:predicted ArsR family transcriptional regulator
MPTDRDPDAGTFAAAVTDEDIFAVIESVDSPFVFPSDVADACDVVNNTAKNHLNDIVEQGRLNHRKAAGRNVYWPPADDE